MPRIDGQSDVAKYFGFECPPVDLCKFCFIDWENDHDKCKHPPYEKQDPPYTCMDCKTKLAEDDN